MANPGSNPRWWRTQRLDRWRRKASHLIWVEYPHDLLPVVPNPEIVPEVSDDQMALLLNATQGALMEDLTFVAELLPNPKDANYVLKWPGEHYRLLAGLGRILRPSLAVEVGTYKGAAAAVMSARCEKVITFDIVPVEKIEDSISDLTIRFPNVDQIVGDLLDEKVWAIESGIFTEADMVFIDGPKDGVFEPAVVPRVLDQMKSGSVMILDDIRFAGMQDWWINGIDYPRIDAGSLGHWSGTGIIFV